MFLELENGNNHIRADSSARLAGNALIHVNAVRWVVTIAIYAVGECQYVNRTDFNAQTTGFA